MNLKKKYFIKNKFYFGPLFRNKTALIYLNKKRKNLFFTLTDLNGLVLCSITAGHFNIKRRKRLSPYTTELMMNKIANCAKFFRIYNINLILKIKSRFMLSIILKVLKSYSFKINSLFDRISCPHNGCRKKKIRRI